VEPEYWDGEIIERPTPNTKHSTTQTFTGSAFLPLRSRFPLTVASDLRVKLRPGLYRLIDVAVYLGPEPPSVADTPPLIATEILSPGDRVSEVMEKFDEYRAWGVAYIWLLDPKNAKCTSTTVGSRE